jgi:hypothetical protein
MTEDGPKSVGLPAADTTDAQGVPGGTRLLAAHSATSTNLRVRCMIYVSHGDEASH